MIRELVDFCDRMYRLYKSRREPEKELHLVEPQSRSAASRSSNCLFLHKTCGSLGTLKAKDRVSLGRLIYPTYTVYHYAKQYQKLFECQKNSTNFIFLISPLAIFTFLLRKQGYQNFAYFYGILIERRWWHCEVPGSFQISFYKFLSNFDYTAGDTDGSTN